MITHLMGSRQAYSLAAKLKIHVNKPSSIQDFISFNTRTIITINSLEFQLVKSRTNNN